MPAKCPNCGHDITPLPSLSEAQAQQIMASVEYLIRNQYLDAQAANGELLEHIRELWDENKALKEQLAALDARA